MIHLYLRATEDWSKVTYETIDYWLFVGHKHLIQMFDETFALTWIEYRRRIKDIAVDNWRYLDVNVIDIGKRNDLSFVNDLEDDDWVLPVDDDDWYHPEMPEKLREVGREFDYVCWDSWVAKTALNFDPIHIYKRSNPDLKYVCTNAYGIRARFLKTLTQPQKRKLIVNHAKSLAWALEFGCNRALDWRGKITPLSAYNWHPGSISLLKFNSELHNDFSIVVPSNQPIKNFKPDYKWMRPYYDRISKVVNSLRKPKYKLHL